MNLTKLFSMISGVALLGLAVGCSTGDDIKGTATIQTGANKSGSAQQVAASSSASVGQRHTADDDAPKAKMTTAEVEQRAAQLAEFCKSVNEHPGDYADEDKIRCDPNIQQ